MFHGCKRLCTSGLRLSLSSRCTGTLSKAEARKRRCQMFEEEKQKQRSQLGRIEKIEVKYQSVEDEVVLVMNRNISTPHDCAKHISESIAKMSAMAFVNGQLWDMHKPFTDNCELQLVTMQSPRVNTINNAFWRTCSLILGAVADNAFKDNVNMHLHSFPYPIIRSGSFVYDVFIDLPNWQPTESELRALSALFVKFTNRELLVERLEVPCSIAQDMFQDNPFKHQQIPDIAKDNDGNIILYRLGDHVDISKGPMINHSGLIGRVSVTTVNRFVNGPVDGLYRFQGLALPKGILLNQFAYNILEKRAKKMNTVMWQPQIEQEIMGNATAN